MLLLLSFCIYDLRTGKKVSLEEVLERVLKEDIKVVYLGEVHTSERIHEFQIRFLKELYRKDTSLAIAYEMFQQPYQEFLDDYISKRIHEVEMLYLTKWHENWKYDIGLYRETWKFAREKGLPLLATNIPKDFRRKVRKMSYERMKKTKYLPPDLQEPDSLYVNQFKAMMGGHAGDFEGLLKVMVAWDEAMAYAIARFMKKNPQRRVVMLVGYGHVYNRLGIPNRVERMTGERGLVFIPLTDLKEDLGKADYGICDY